MNRLSVKILTPTGRIEIDEVDVVNVQTVMGQTGILPNHSTLLSILEPGIARIRKNKKNILYKIGNGYLQVDNNEVLIFTNQVHRSPSGKTH